MAYFVETIRFKIILAFGVCVIIMAAIGFFGAYGLSRLSSKVVGGHSGNTVPITKLSEVRAAQLNVRLLLRRIQVTHDPAKTTEFSADSNCERKRARQTRPDFGCTLRQFERLNKSWNHSYSDSVSGDKEREIAVGITSSPPQVAVR
ncbi:MCP four helix bundle domain-containing protein [Paraburkholderia hospita]|uniref:MCP four helix bundle domain-containing protein n=1 Tax=Paraburkholderia hospita TaxID=169430 RepID=UPI003ED0B351